MATTSSSTGHIRKRQYQPSIHSYFGARDVNPSASPQLQFSSPSPLSPPLPPDTQASLLSVGMRVRKSVPEGYKTHKTLKVDQYPFPSSAPPVPTSLAQTTYTGSSPRELMPFCGLHKTGGWASQAMPASSAPAVMRDSYDNDEDMVPELMRSQSSVLFTQNRFISAASKRVAGSKKRSYDEEVEEEMDAYFLEVENVDGQMRMGDRPMARMKGTGARGVVHVAGVDEFEEAGFLVPMDDMDVDGT